MYKELTPEEQADRWIQALGLVDNSPEAVCLKQGYKVGYKHAKQWKNVIVDGYPPEGKVVHVRTQIREAKGIPSGYLIMISNIDKITSYQYSADYAKRLYDNLLVWSSEATWPEWREID